MDNLEKIEVEVFISELRTEMKFKENIFSLMPAIFELIHFDDLLWEDLKERYLENTRVRYIDYINNGRNPIIIKPSFYDYAVDAMSGNEYDKHLISFINKVIEEIVDNFTNDEKKLIMDSLQGFLVSVDEKFFNYLGELLIANQVQKNGFEIIGREIPVHKDFKRGALIDFVIRHNENKSILNIEVVNVHFTKLDDDEDYLIKRITDRFRKKLLKQNKNGITNQYILLPNFWCNISQVIAINEIYTKGLIKVSGTHEPSVFIKESNDEVVHYRYGVISSYFENGKFIPANL